MGSLADGLLRAGLVTEDTVAEHESRKRQLETSATKQAQSKLIRKSQLPVNLDQLDAVESTSAFRRATLEILLVHPNVISEVIEKVHRFKDESGGKKLIWQIYQVRDGLEKIDEKDYKVRERFLRRGLRRSGGTFDILRQ